MRKPKPISENRSAYYRQRKAARICQWCGEQTDGQHSLCDACREKHRRKYREIRAKGLCSSCGKQAIKGQAKCESCVVRERKYSADHKARQKEKGQCACCGKEAEPHKTLCKECSTKRRERRAETIRQGLCEMCRKPRGPDRTYCDPCWAKRQAHHQAVKDEVFGHYGGYACACCGETERAFLTIDHVRNDGAKHRREQGRKAYSICRWLRLNGFPDGFQVLCMNCNWAKRLGQCPHEKRRQENAEYTATINSGRKSSTELLRQDVSHR